MKRTALLLLAAAMIAGVVDGRAQTSSRMTEKETTMASSSPVSAEATNLFLLEDLKNVRRTSKIEKGDLGALNAVAEWINSFIVTPHKDLGRAGPVCPFVPAALEHKTLWLAPERIANRSASDVIRLMDGYKELLLSIPPVDGVGADTKSVVVVFSDLSPDDAKGLFDEVLGKLSVASYAEDGLVLGGFYEGNQGTALYNASFRPFVSPAPFLLVRRAVISDWKFFLNNEEMLTLWARRYGESGVQVLAEELRQLPWNARRG